MIENEPKTLQDSSVIQISVDELFTDSAAVPEQVLPVPESTESFNARAAKINEVAHRMLVQSLRSK